MKNITIALIFILALVSVVIPSATYAKSRSGSAYYRSARTGQYTTKSYSGSHKSTTYRSTYR